MLLAAGDPRDVLAVKIGEVLLADLLAHQDEQRALVLGALVPEERAVGVDDDLVALGVGGLGKGLLAERFGGLGLKLSGQRHFKLRGHAAADACGRVQRVERVIIFLHAGQVLGHGAVDAPVDRGHHVAYDIRLVHGIFLLKKLLLLKFTDTLQLKVYFQSRGVRKFFDRSLRKCERLTERKWHHII